MSREYPGLPEPPPLGGSALPAGTYDGQVVVVTGGGTGLGKAMAIEFARLGATIVVASRSDEHIAAGIAAVEEVGGRALGVGIDVRQWGHIDDAFARSESELGPADVLVNNAAGNFPIAAEDLSPNGFRAVTATVLDGTFLCSKRFAQPLMDTRRPGAILNIGASYAWTGGPGFVHNSAAKAAVKNLTETLAVEWAPYGIRVNNLVPGLFPHEDQTDDINAVPGRGQDEESRAPAMRTGRRRELGWAATFLCSPYAAYVTGATLTVDGANWQRREMLRAPFTPIREQLGPNPRT